MRLERTLKRVALPLRLFLSVGEALGMRGFMIWPLSHRPDFFGRQYGRLTQGVMRAASVWAPEERELFAAFTARVESCPF